ncbi:MAG TPA: CPBP family intramembrane glutamic endopeptidase [Kineosporiaceae bacterium]|nr:CPBP family intramembrane glutamic endopeptidase [Kineosporiaceae bacterium]
MDISFPVFERPRTDVLDAPSRIEPPQYTLRAIVIIWALAALPMAALAWVGAPLLRGHLAGTGDLPLVKALLLCLTIGLVWQFMLVVALVWREQHTLRWSVVRDALWLRPPRSPRSSRVGGRLWLILVPLIVAVGLASAIHIGSIPPGRDLGLFLDSSAGKTFLHGAWGWYGLLLTMFLFNTVLGEELLFRGLLLPRMNGVFGRLDWLANGALFAVYHLHVPWAIPSTLLDTFLVAYPVKRYGSAWIGIAVHSAQSVVLAVLVLTLVL